MSNELAVMPAKVPCLVEKIAAACDAVGGVDKRGRNKEQGYDYVKAADVAKAIRHELFSRGVILLAHENAPEYAEVVTSKGFKMAEVRLCVTYTLTDGTNVLVSNAYGVARDSGDKAIYKAKTGALKYFLRGLGLIPDEADDPEHDGGEDRLPPDTAKDFATKAVAAAKPTLTEALRKSVELEAPKGYQEDEDGNASFTLTRVSKGTDKKGRPFRTVFWEGGRANCFKADAFSEIDKFKAGDRVGISGVTSNNGYVNFDGVLGIISPEEMVGAIAGSHTMPKAEITDSDIPF